jgi:hypothetical protein
MPILKTFIHVSDLHFSGVPAQKAQHPWRKYVPHLPGMAGHNDGVLRYLQSFYIRARANDPSTEVIITGDLTVCGAKHQFDAADAYFGATYGSHKLGLNRARWADWSIPGNHDFWSGLAITAWGFTNTEVRRRYPNDFGIGPRLALRNGKSVQFYYLNSDADVAPFSPERMYACGSFCSAIGDLDALLSSRDPYEIRVLLLHHSVQYSGLILGGTSNRWLPVSLRLKLRHLTINDASRVELEKLLAKHDIRVVLTGHVHRTPYVGRITTGTLRSGHNVLEACCGTTALLPLAPAVGKAQNTLILHKIEEDRAGRVLWTSEAQSLNLGGSNGFGSFSAPAAPNTRASVVVSP